MRAGPRGRDRPISAGSSGRRSMYVVAKGCWRAVCQVRLGKLALRMAVRMTMLLLLFCSDQAGELASRSVLLQYQHFMCAVRRGVSRFRFRIMSSIATSIVAAIARVRCKSVSCFVTDATDTRQRAATTKWTPPTARNCAADCIVQCPQNTSSAHSSIRAPSVRKPSRVMSPQL